MTREEWVLEQLKARKDWNKVLEGGGKSSSYSGLRRFESYVAPKVKELQEELAKLEDQNEEQKEKNAKLENECSTKEAKVVALNKKVADLTGRKTTLDVDVQVLETRATKLRETETELKQRGITLETITTVAATDAADPFDLLKRVKTAAESEAEEKRLNETRQETQRITAKNSVLDKMLTDKKQEAASWDVRLADVKRQVKINEDSNLIVQKAFSRGYSPEALNGLFDSLQRFEVKGSPDASIKRLIRGFDGVKELEEIGNRVRQKTAQEEQVNADLSKVQGVMAAALNTFIPTLNKALVKAEAEITTLSDAAVKEMSELSKHHQGEIIKMEQNAEGNIATMSDFWLKEQQRTLNLANQTALNVTGAFHQCSADIQKWGEIKTEAGKYEADLKWGHYIQSLIGDPKLARDMPTPLVLQLADCINLWVERRLPEATTLPPSHVSQQESSFSRVFPVKLSVITDWVRFSLRDQQRRGVV